MDFTYFRLRGLTDVRLPIFNAAEDDKYIVKSFDGLGPPEVDPVIANTPSGGHYQGRQIQGREANLMLGLNPDWDNGETPAQMRDELYALLSTGYNPKVLFQVMRNENWVITSDVAYIKRIDPIFFTKDPVVQMTITFLNSELRAPQQKKIGHAFIDLHTPGITNVGSAETGFQFSIKFTADKARWFIKTAEDQRIGMTFVKDFNSGDVLSVSTIPGKKFIHWNKHRGKVTNKMGILTDDSEWLTMHPGLNLWVVPNGGWQWVGNFVYTPLYWGV